MKDRNHLKLTENKKEKSVEIDGTATAILELIHEAMKAIHGEEGKLAVEESNRDVRSITIKKVE